MREKGSLHEALLPTNIVTLQNAIIALLNIDSFENKD